MAAPPKPHPPCVVGVCTVGLAASRLQTLTVFTPFEGRRASTLPGHGGRSLTSPSRLRALELNLKLCPAPEGNTRYFVTPSLQLSDKLRCAEGSKAGTAPVATATDVLPITPSPITPHLEQKRCSDLCRRNCWLLRIMTEVTS